MTSSGGGKPAPKPITAQQSCPPLPADIRAEIGRRTTIPAGDLKKSQVMNLLRKFGTSEVRKDQRLRQVANLYDRCRAQWFK